MPLRLNFNFFQRLATLEERQTYIFSLRKKSHFICQCAKDEMLLTLLWHHHSFYIKPIFKGFFSRKNVLRAIFFLILKNKKSSLLEKVSAKLVSFSAQRYKFAEKYSAKNLKNPFQFLKPKSWWFWRFDFDQNSNFGL